MSENISTELINEEGRSLISVILLFFKLYLLIILIDFPFAFAAAGLKDYKLYEACIFVQIIGILFSYFYVSYNHCKKEKFKINIRQKFSIKFLLYMLLLLIGYRLLYDTTLGAFLDRFEVSKTLVEASNLWHSAKFFGTIRTCIIASIVEELLLRGILLENIRKRYSSLTAILVSSLIFAIIHGNLHQGVNTFFMGLCLGLVYIKTNSLLASIFFHMANNTLATLTNYPFVNIYEMRPIVISISLVLLVLSLLLISRTKVDENKKFNFKFLKKHELVQ